MSHRSKITLSILGLIILSLVLIVAFFDWNLLRGYIGRKVTEKSGREFAIDGNLKVTPFSLAPRIRAERVRFANSEWGTEKQMFSADSVEFRVRLFPLFHGNVILPEVNLSHPNIILEKSADGRRNWVLDKKREKEESEPPHIGRLVVDEGVLVFRDPTIKTDIRLQVSTDQSVGSTQAGAVRFKADGRFKGMEAHAEGAGASVLLLEDQSTPYALKGNVQIAKTQASFDGAITGLTKFAAVDAQLGVRGNSMADLYPLANIALPATPPYKINGRLVHEGTAWSLNNFSGKVGDSDLSGDFKIDKKNNRNMLTANLVSQKLDFDDLGGLVGAPPKTGAGETASPEQKKQSAKLAASNRALPDAPFRFEKLNAMDADVRFDGKSIRREGLPLDSLKTHLKLDHGKLVLDPLTFGIANGSASGKVTLDAQEPTIKADLDLRFNRLHLGKLFPKVQLTKANAGLIGGRVKVKGTGNSIAKILGTSNGDIGFAMSGGEISNLLLEIAHLNGAEIIKLLFGGDKKVPLRCAVADFDVKQGLMTTEVFVIDSEDTNIRGSGTINLANESMNLTFNPVPKHKGFLSLRSPLYLKGTFKNPQPSIDVPSVAARGGAVVLGALINPILALVPLIETGPGKDSNCGALIQEVKQDTGLKNKDIPRNK